MRPFRFALHLKDFGWEPVVLTIAASGQHMTPKEKQLLSEIEIIEIRSPFDWTSSSESHLGTNVETRPLADRSKAVAGTPRRSRGLGEIVLETLDRQFPTDTWLLLFAAKYRELQRIVRRVQPDILWCTGDPWSGLVAAQRLAERTDLPWVADFRDPWTLSGLRTAGQWPLSRRADAYFERRIIESADVVVFQTSSVDKSYRIHYDDVDFDTRVITNSFDPSVFDDPITFDTAKATPVSHADGLHIGFFGRFRAMSPASLIIDALSIVRRRDPDQARRIYVHSFGSLNETDSSYAGECGVATSFVREDAVPLQDSLAVLRGFDLLLVSTDVSREHIIPSKLFEYLAAGRPILSLSRNPEVRTILEETGTGIQLDPLRPEAVADCLIRCLEACDERRTLPVPFQPEAPAIARFEARETTRQLATIFDEITESRM